MSQVADPGVIESFLHPSCKIYGDNYNKLSTQSLNWSWLSEGFIFTKEQFPFALSISLMLNKYYKFHIHKIRLSSINLTPVFHQMKFLLIYSSLFIWQAPSLHFLPYKFLHVVEPQKYKVYKGSVTRRVIVSP